MRRFVKEQESKEQQERDNEHKPHEQTAALGGLVTLPHCDLSESELRIFGGVQKRRGGSALPRGMTAAPLRKGRRKRLQVAFDTAVRAMLAGNRNLIGQLHDAEKLSQAAGTFAILTGNLLSGDISMLTGEPLDTIDKRVGRCLTALEQCNPLPELSALEVALLALRYPTTFKAATKNRNDGFLRELHGILNLLRKSVG